MKTLSFISGLLAIVTFAISFKAGLFGFFKAGEFFTGILIGCAFTVIFLIADKKSVQKSN